MLQLNPTIDVQTPLGDGEAFFIVDYGVNVNTVWVCRMAGGEVKHFYSDDVRIYDNPMNGNGWDVDKVNKLPKGAVRNMDFLKPNKDL
jgi:hypothetical protein